MATGFLKQIVKQIVFGERWSVVGAHFFSGFVGGEGDKGASRSEGGVMLGADADVPRWPFSVHSNGGDSSCLSLTFEAPISSYPTG